MHREKLLAPYMHEGSSLSAGKKQPLLPWRSHASRLCDTELPEKIMKDGNKKLSYDELRRHRWAPL